MHEFLEGLTAYVALLRLVLSMELQETGQNHPARDHREAGRLGGYATLARYGREQMREWGRGGGRPRARTYDDIRQQQRPEQQSTDEVTGSPGNLRELRALYRLRRQVERCYRTDTGKD